MDYGARYAEKREQVIARRLQSLYREAQRDLTAKIRQFTESKEKRGAELLQAVQDGRITEQEYKRWLSGQAFIGKRWREKLDQVTQSIYQTNQKAAAIVRGEQLNVFSENANYEAFKIERDFHGAYSFDIYDEATVERLVKQQPALLPPRKVDRDKDVGWNQEIISNSVAQGVIQGESVDQIAKRIAHDTASHDMKAMTRYARTAVTSAQNAGRLETMHRAKDMGIKVQKQWVATLDSRTRDSHRKLDGQTVDIDKPFLSEFGEIEYPGDPKAEAGDVYNCRCTMIYVYPDYPERDADWRSGQEIDGMTYDEWKENKQQEQQQPEEEQGTGLDRVRQLIYGHEGEWHVDQLQEVGHEMAGAVTERVQNRTEELQRTLDSASTEYEQIKQQIADTRSEINRLDAEGKYEEADKLEQKLNELTAKRSEAWLRMQDASNSLHFAQGDAVRECLSEIRPVGGVTDSNFKQFMDVGRRSKTSEELVAGMNCYPTAWLQASAENGISLTPKMNSSARGYYMPSVGEIMLSGRRGTTVHELGHRFEATVRGILESEREFYARRTAGESLEWLGRGYGRSEVTRRDHFINPYMGKDYGGRAFELVSMGFEFAFTDYERLCRDEDMRDWILGLLCSI